MEIEDLMKTAEDWITGFLEYSPLFEYQVTEEEKKRTLESFREHIQNYIDLELINDGCGELTYYTADC